MRFFFIGLMVFLSICFNTFSSENTTIIIRSDTQIEFVLQGFKGFERLIIGQKIVAPDSQVELLTDYKGFALLIFKDGQQYPVIISDSILHIDLHEANTPPNFKNSSENEFLYEWLSKYRKQQHVLLLLQKKQDASDITDLINLEEIKAEQSEVEKQQQQHIETLANPEFKYVNTLLKARLLNESSSNIKTIDDLNAKKEEYHQFIDKNYEILQHSDMIIQLAAQYFMMHEYVSHVKKDISHTKMHYQNAVVTGVGKWIKILQNRISSTKVIEFCAKLYYDRSMVTMAILIFDYYRDEFVAENINYLFPLKKQLPDFEFVNAMRLNKQNSSNLRANKIVAIVSDKSLFSKVETIALARSLADSNINIPIIITPIERLSESHLILDKMFAGDLYFMDDKAWQEKYLNKEISLPQFILLDKDSKIIKISNYRDVLFK